MANKFVTDKDFDVIGIVHTVVKNADGEIRYDVVNHNTVKDGLKNRLCAAVKSGVFAAVSDYATIANSETSEWTGKDGIMVFNNAFTTKDGRLLKCASTAANTINSLVIQGTNSLYDDGTMSAFALGTNVNTDTAFAENYFEHNPDTFEYSAGDTITVNWTISVT